MAEIVFSRNLVLRVKVTKIEENKKTIPKGNGVTMQRHDLYIEDEKGNTARVEYLNHSLTCHEFVVGVWQYMRCTWPDEKGSTVEPYDPERPNVPNVPRETPQSGLPQQNAYIPNVNQDRPPVIQHAIASDANVGGKAIVFAMAYAKDLKVAEIAKRKAGAKVTDDDISEMISWAKQLRMGLLDFDSY